MIKIQNTKYTPTLIIPQTYTSPILIKLLDREKIISNLKVTINDKDKDCSLFESNYSLSQFYIFASSDQFLSNQKAVKKLKKNNTEALVKKFFNEIDEIDLTCDK